jgi:hypothetical protein
MHAAQLGAEHDEHMHHGGASAAVARAFELKTRAATG